MNAFKLVLAICLGFLVSCNTKQEFRAIDKSIEKDSLVTLRRTVIADLPDSLQPKTFLLKDMPKPKVRHIHEIETETTLLPVLKNDKGEPILDQEGNTILMGGGGLSNFTTFTTDDGLALESILCSFMDRTGNLWFGTQGGGVSRYDGKSFTNFTIAHGLVNNSIWSIFEDTSGNLWFGSDGTGVSRYNGKSFANFSEDQGLSYNVVRDIAEDKDGNIWLGTFDGLNRFDGKSFTTFSTAHGLADNNVWCITEDKNGDLLFGTMEGGVSRYDGQTFTTLSTDHGLASNAVWRVKEDSEGILWFGTLGGGVSRYEPSDWLKSRSGSLPQGNVGITNFSTNEGLANNLVRNITEDNAGNLWFGTDGGGVSRFNGKVFTNFTTVQGLANNNILSISKDKTGSLWFATYGGGVSRYDGPSFTTFSKAHGLPSSFVVSITEDKDGNLWFSTDEGGLSYYDGKSFTNFNLALGQFDNGITSIIEDRNGSIWMSTMSFGVFRYDGNSFTNYTTDQGLVHSGIRNITEDRAGNLWFVTVDGKGMSRYDGKSITNFSTVQGLAHDDISLSMEDSSGNLWFGTNGGGLSYYDGETFTNLTTAHGLANNYIMSIVEDKSGNLWFGTVGGLSFLDLESYIEHSNQDSIPATLFRSFGTAEGLPDNNITQVLQMPNGKMAVGTNLGISIFNISDDLSNLTDMEIFNTSTGYPVKDVNGGQGTMLLDSKGIIWAGTGSESSGLVRFDYEALNKNEDLPMLVIESVKVKDEPVSWHTLIEFGDENRKSNFIDEKVNPLDSISVPAYITDEVSLFGRELTLAERDSMTQRFKNLEFDGITPFYHLPQNLVLPYKLNQVSFEFVAIETSRPQMVRYQYLLEGYDDNWSPVTNRSNASFGNIHEGTYTFRLKALGANGMWTDPVTYTFTVLPPWYRSWWAYGIYALFLIGLVWRIHLIQKAKTLRKEREKTKDKELAQAKEIEKAYGELGMAHQTLKSTQAQLIQSEKMASLGELTAGIAHEIQNPLNFVNNFSEVSSELLDEMNAELEKGDIEEAKFISNDIKQNLEKINHHGKRADAIVKGMLEHSRISSGEKVLTDINGLADEYLRLSYHGMRAKDKSFNADFETNFDPNLPKINVVPQEIGRVVLNIINNAFQAFTNSEFLIHNSELKPLVKVSTMKNGDNLEIRVSDNGPGIPDAIKTKIFQPFFTTKPTGQGTGLGLSLSYDIVKAHGGEIKVDSEEGKGTTFIILLPT
ncbi:ATP-binding protein [Aquiflexum sp. TKW24L]|uniref:two-component regulator propeller domain-containing protein n=1 Tax=Aquiflexum sp. TKW24L TaxID=2942212 RepID=UPI0020C015CF|nr:two-component regulator propeller domain-containing protein [Aquiflexum sp. TKW24L]MCL6257629.1 ATP-binding protein [Aquiflexum sp. TKW24L]